MRESLWFFNGEFIVSNLDSELSLYYTVEQSLYEQLVLRKKNGEKLEFDDITYTQLYILCRDQCIPDSGIAELYDVSILDVKKKRHKVGMKKGDIPFKKEFEFYFENKKG